MHRRKVVWAQEGELVALDVPVQRVIADASTDCKQVSERGERGQGGGFDQCDAVQAQPQVRDVHAGLKHPHRHQRDVVVGQIKVVQVSQPLEYGAADGSDAVRLQLAA